MQKYIEARHQWLTSVIPASQEAEIRRIVVQTQPGQRVRMTLSKKNSAQKRAGGVAQGVGPEFKPHYLKIQTINKPRNNYTEEDNQISFTINTDKRNSFILFLFYEAE
jgi:hypothetical protein